jgi:hypothetical protein
MTQSTQSPLATKELLHIISPSDPNMKARCEIARIFGKKNFKWMSQDIFVCDNQKLRSYAHIAFFFNPTEELGNILLNAGIYNFADCGECGIICTPAYYYGVSGKPQEPLCNHCAGEILN